MEDTYKEIFSRRKMMASSVLIVAFCFTSVGSLLYGAAPDAGLGTDEVLVEVNGAKLTIGNLAKNSAEALFQARNNYYEAERKVILDGIDDYLLANQAAKEGLTVDQLVERHITSTIGADPSEESLKVYYEGLDTTQSYEAVRARILDAVRQRRIAKAKAAYLKKLRENQAIVLRLEPPRAPISMKDVPVRGPAVAPVTVLEFADYECPYCQQLKPILDQLESEYKDKVAFAYKDFPLPAHPDAPKAAEAAHCAGDQGKYWEYHDMLFAKKQLDVPSLKKYSTDLKLDAAAFSSCLDTGKMAGVVNEMASEANTLALQGTPTLFVNGRMVNGSVSYGSLKSVIDEELSAVAQPATKATASNSRSQRPSASQ